MPGPTEEAKRYHPIDGFYGWYSNSSRGRRRNLEREDSPEPEHSRSQEDPPDAAERRRLRRLWATKIRRIYEVDPLGCRKCRRDLAVVRRQ